jgi:pilus assembly protein Flp/PilA
MLARFRQAANRFSQDESGATAIEYGLIAALMGVAIIAALFNFSDKTRNLYGYIGNNVNNAITN